MTEEMYVTRRAVIVSRILQHGKKFSDGRPMFPKCLAADYRALEKLDNEWNKSRNEEGGR